MEDQILASWVVNATTWTRAVRRGEILSRLRVTNRAILEAVLQGGGTAAQRDVVILNTGLVLWAAGRTDRLADGVAQARSSLEAGQPWQRLEALRQALASPG